MSQSQPNKADKPIHCIACGKIIGQGYIVAGSIKLLCKCGVKTKIEAEIKPEGRIGIAYEPGFDSRGNLAEVSIVKKRIS